MAEKRMGITVLLLCLCLCIMPCCARAASTADAKEAIVPDRACTLTLSYRCGGAALPGVAVKLYKIADVSADFQYTLTSPFASTGLALNSIQHSGEWNAVRATLEVHIMANRTAETRSATTGSDGLAHFDALTPGLYLAISGDVPDCYFDSALIALPGLGADGLWQYDVTASPKGQPLPPVAPDEMLEYRLLKLWKGDEEHDARPQSIVVDIFKNGELDHTVTLSAENNWAYSWTAPADGASWHVTEAGVPEGYVLTVEKRDAMFILTNTLTPTDPPGGDVPPADSPETGDNPHMLLYTALMYISGIALVILGITGKRKRT